MSESESEVDIKKQERQDSEHREDELTGEVVREERDEVANFVSSAVLEAEKETVTLLDAVGSRSDVSPEELAATMKELAVNTTELKIAAEAVEDELATMENETIITREQALATLTTQELSDEVIVDLFRAFEKMKKNDDGADTEPAIGSETQSGFERKFLVKQMPDLSSVIPIQYERLFLHIGDNVEARIQCKEKNDEKTYELEIKLKNGKGFERTTKKIVLSKDEYGQLKESAQSKPYAPIDRKNYVLSDGRDGRPPVSIKTYPDGFARVEVEFPSKALADAYAPDTWFGEEITGTDLALDSHRSKPSSKSDS